jgi:hypothetical protein
LLNKADALRHYINQANDGMILSIEELALQFGFSPKELTDFMRLASVRKHLKTYYQLEPPPLTTPDRDLTDQQRAWLSRCTDPYTTKSVRTLATEFGITVEEHRRWLKQATFRNAYEKLLAQDARSAKGEVTRKAVNRAMAGEGKAVELYFRMAGQPIAQASKDELSEAAVPLTRLLEVLQTVLTPQQLNDVTAAILTGPPKEIEQPTDGFSE